jgi:hypothetical protein
MACGVRGLLGALGAVAALGGTGCGGGTTAPSGYDPCAQRACPPYAWSWDLSSVAERPLATRATADITVTTDLGLRDFTTASADPSIVSVSHLISDHRTIHLTGGVAGITRLTLADAGTGARLDAIDVEVADVGTVTFDARSGLDYHQTFTLSAGGDSVITVSLADATARPLAGVGALDYTSGDGLTEVELRLAGGPSVYYESVELTALNPGTGTLRATAPSGASAALPVAIVDDSAVASIDFRGLGTEAYATSYSGIALYAEAFEVTGEPIHSPGCGWTVVASPETALTESTQMRDQLSLMSANFSTVTATCAIGAAAAAITIEFQDPMPSPASR